MREKKFNFVEYFPRDEVPQRDEVLKVSFNCKNGILFFGPKIVRAHDLDNKLIKLYYDSEKNAIGWRYFNSATQEQLEGMRLMKVNKNGVITLALRKLMKRFLKLQSQESFPGLPVKQYKDSFNDDIYYIVLEK